jgi:hypothetical protein
MWSAVLLACVLLPRPVAQDAGNRPPDPARVQAAVKDLREAFGKGDAAARIAAIEASADLLDPDVIAGIDKGLRDADENVRAAAVTAFRTMDHPAVLKCLHQEFERNKKLELGPDHVVSVVKAIGEHGSNDSVAVLAKDMLACPDHKVIMARILALGNIRTSESVEALFDMMKLAGPHKVQPFMSEFRLSLLVLTGADQGPSQELWMRWWNEHKKDLAVLPEPPQLAKQDARRWYGFWDRYPKEERQEKRGERGGDGGK